jgi:hypothetical protein
MKKRKITRQYSDEVTAGRLPEDILKKVKLLNKKLFNNTKTNSEMTRILIQFAMEQIEKLKIEVYHSIKAVPKKKASR